MDLGLFLTLFKLVEDAGLTTTRPPEPEALKERREFIELGLKRPDK
jgi:hypothetical protein